MIMRFGTAPPVPEELSLLPIGGRMVITATGIIYDDVNTTNLEYLIQDTSDREIIRQVGYPGEVRRNEFLISSRRKNRSEVARFNR